MIVVETPVHSLNLEIERLVINAQGKSPEYIQGAIDAVNWVLCGSPPPSGDCTIPVAEMSLDIH